MEKEEEASRCNGLLCPRGSVLSFTILNIHRVSRRTRGHVPARLIAIYQARKKVRCSGCRVSYVHVFPEACNGEGLKFGNGVAFQVPATNVLVRANASCGDVWTEYQEMSWKDVQEVAAGSVYTTEDLVNLLRKVAPKLMVRGDDNWGYGLADDLSDPKYQHFRHWSNPLETT